MQANRFFKNKDSHLNKHEKIDFIYIFSSSKGTYGRFKVYCRHYKIFVEKIVCNGIGAQRETFKILILNYLGISVSLETIFGHEC